MFEIHCRRVKFLNPRPLIESPNTSHCPSQALQSHECGLSPCDSLRMAGPARESNCPCTCELNVALACPRCVQKVRVELRKCFGENGRHDWARTGDLYRVNSQAAGRAGSRRRAEGQSGKEADAETLLSRGKDYKKRPFQDYRWSRFKNTDPRA